jgi:hypothetical protein
VDKDFSNEICTEMLSFVYMFCYRVNRQRMRELDKPSPVTETPIRAQVLVSFKHQVTRASSAKFPYDVCNLRTVTKSRGQWLRVCCARELRLKAIRSFRLWNHAMHFDESWHDIFPLKVIFLAIFSLRSSFYEYGLSNRSCAVSVCSLIRAETMAGFLRNLARKSWY